MGRLSSIACGLTAFLVTVTGAKAQTTLDPNWARAQEVANLQSARQRAQVAAAPLADPAFAVQSTATLAQPSAFRVQPERAFGGAIEFQSPSPSLSSSAVTANVFGARVPDRFDGLAATQRSEAWFDSGRHSDRVRLTTRGTLRRADGSPLPVTARDRDAFDVDAYDVSFTRGWSVARGYTRSGLEVTLTPHAGFGVGDDGGSAEAGATLKIGDNLDRLAPSGHQRFGDRARWYLYAAGSGRAVGYNFARTRDGDYARSGMSQDKGSFLGDASIGVAYRRGAMQGSFGVVYREIKAEGLRGGEGFDRDVSEGLVAFQLSIRPQW